MIILDDGISVFADVLIFVFLKSRRLLRAEMKRPAVPDADVARLLFRYLNNMKRF